MVTQLEALGFCGADDTVNPRLLILIGQSYPLVEWGILFRPDKEGQPRYASKEWVCRLSELLKKKNDNPQQQKMKKIKLAAHLCGSHVNDLLLSSTNKLCAAAIDEFLHQLYDWGFRRVQVNATAVNGVFTEKLGTKTTVESFLRTVNAHTKMEFIVQKNNETEPLWSYQIKFPDNVVFLHDESKGTGKEVSGWPTDSTFISHRKSVGYAGGIKPTNVKSIIKSAQRACSESGGITFWIDMESGVRTTQLKSDGSTEDTFDLAKCYECNDIVCDAGLMDHPPELRCGNDNTEE